MADLEVEGRNPALLATEYNNKGQQYYLDVCFDEAIIEYTRAIEADASFYVAYYNRGQVHYRMGRFEEARLDFKKTLELNPSFQEAEKALQASDLALQKLAV